MASSWQAFPLVASPSYPNSIAWSNENLVAVASGHVITILNPALLDGPRGMITLTPSSLFPIGIVRREDLLTPCLMPTCLSRNNHSCARSISWSQPGFTSNSGCLLAVCTTDGRVKLYRPPLFEFLAEWVEVVDISEMLCHYLVRTNFGEPSLPKTSLPKCEKSLAVKSGKRSAFEFRDRSSSKDPSCKGNVISRRSERVKYRKSQRKELHHGSDGENSHKHVKYHKNDNLTVSPNSVGTSSEEHEGSPHSNTNRVSSVEVIEVSSKNVVKRKKVYPISEGSTPLITPEQYASRSAILSSLIVAWSPVFQSSGTKPDFPNRCTLLAVGAKSGNISFWKLCEPECYSVEDDRVSVDPMLVGFLQAHESWITAISWEIFTTNSSVSQLILATGSSDGSCREVPANAEQNELVFSGARRVCFCYVDLGFKVTKELLTKMWAADVEDLACSAEANDSLFSLINVVATVSMPASISLISLAIPKQSQEKIVLAIGKGSGSLEVWICNVSYKKVQSAGFYEAHDQVVTGLTWAFDGVCLYSCSQDNSIQSWVLHGDYLHKVSFPFKFPGSWNSNCHLQASEQCFGLALSPGGLMIAAVRSFDSDLLNQMYQARTQKAVVELFWIGGQSYEISLKAKNVESSATLSETDFLCWESNILGCLRKFENKDKLLVLWDILAALIEFKKYCPKFVDNLLIKWISSWFSDYTSGDSIDKVLFQTHSHLSEISSRKIYLLNLISRRLMPSVAKDDMLNPEYCESNEPKSEGRFDMWNNLLVNNELELQQRILAFTFRSIVSRASCTSALFPVGKNWFPLGVAQMQRWVHLHTALVNNQLNVLGSELRRLESSISSICECIEEEACSFCSAPVPFESANVAWCDGGKLNSSSNDRHRLLRCMVSMKLCSIAAPMWSCMSCQRSAVNLMPRAFFTLSESDADLLPPDILKPICPFCGILLQKSMPEFLLSSSPV